MPQKHITDTVTRALQVAKSYEEITVIRLNDAREQAQNLERELAEKRAEIEAYEQFLREHVG